jgi:hypothetical protein
MADAINTGNPVTTAFVVNKYDDIDGANINQETPRGRLAFRDTNGRMTLPRTTAEANKAMFPVDWPKPLNPAPYFDGPGLNGTTLYPFSDGSKDASESTYTMDPDLAFSTPWPAAIKQYDLPPALYGLPVTSGNKCLVYDGGVFTYGSGAYTGVISDYVIGSPVYAAFDSGNEGKIAYTVSGVATARSVGTVYSKEVFGDLTVTVKLKGVDGLL